ncbi:ribosomal protection-like ABC-F family protein [Paenibacillus sp. y28]|uniref:ribosomal protection-like ABC-F family protein n=1 Tax=Paenibacillus sp. y28 TaxID=3129110 RepID=UPI00301ADF7D
MNIISAEHLSKSYGTKVLLSDVSFHINEKDRIGLIGVNGTGKTTLLSLLAGKESPDEGKLLHAKHFQVEYLPQQPEFEPDSTVLEQVFYGDSTLMKVMRSYEHALAALEAEPDSVLQQELLLKAQQQLESLNGWDAQAEAKTILQQLGIRDYDKPVRELSGGQRKRVALARALLRPADLLILDEPTNHLDYETVLWLEQALQRYKGALLFVTHDRYFLDRVARRMFELDRGKLYSYEGNYSLFLDKKAERLEQEAASESKRQNLLRRELAWLARGPKARTTKQKARIDRAETLRDQQVAAPEEALDMAVGGSRLGKKVIEAKRISKTYDGQALFKNFDYIVLPDDRIGIIGPSGSGKSTLLNVLAGRLEPDQGEVDTGPTVKLAYYTQEAQEMKPEQRVIEYIKEVAEQIRTKDGDVISAGQMLERFLFPGSVQWTPIGRLSGGERRRLYLLRTLMMEPNVLFLDEPTNDLDIQTLSILEDYLESFPGAVITVSHDRYFLDRTVDHLFIMEPGGSIQHFLGTASEAVERFRTSMDSAPVGSGHNKRSVQTKQDESAASPVQAGAAAASAAAGVPKKLSYKDQKEWDEIEERIAGLEERLGSIASQIETTGSDYDKVRELYEEQQRLTTELEQAMDRWTELSELVELIEQNKQNR